MSVAKIPTSDSYHNYLIARLQTSSEAAAYLDAILEEEDPEPTLLKSALLDIVEALSKTQLAPQAAELQQQKLDEILALPGSLAIYGLAAWLQGLGLKLTVTVADAPEETA